mgnify:CR=1 FL=1
MPCYSPLKGYRSRLTTDNGKRKIVFNTMDGYSDLPVTVPCGQCIGCRLERSRQWAVRCYHEASLYEKNCFITLTFNKENLPVDRSLDVRTFQLFMKKLRKKYKKENPYRKKENPDLYQQFNEKHAIRFYHCGEYGDKNGRPHYHACIFNHDFTDKIYWSKTKNGDKLYRSEELEDLWPYGFSTIGEVTFQSAAYVARYIMKKVNGKNSAYHYTDYNPDTGEILSERKPEYTTMSRRPGIGKKWLEKYKSDVFTGDFIILNGKKIRPPKFYDGQFEITNLDEFKLLKKTRKNNAKKHATNNTPERLEIRKKIQELKLRRLERNHDA